MRAGAALSSLAVLLVAEVESVIPSYSCSDAVFLVLSNKIAIIAIQDHPFRLPKQWRSYASKAKMCRNSTLSNLCPRLGSSAQFDIECIGQRGTQIPYIL